MRLDRISVSATALCALAVLAAAPAAADAVYAIDGDHSEVTFQVRHLLTQVRGSFHDFAGEIRMAEDPADSSVVLTIRAASIDTANAERDAHLRSADFFDVDEYEEITFTSSRVVATGDDTYDVTGILDMHGVEKEIVLPVTFLGEMDFRGATRGGFTTAVKLDRTDWGIVWNSPLDQGGTVLGDEVAIEINLEVIRQETEAAGEL